MKLTNRLGLPDAIVRAVANDGYTGHGLTATGLIAPPYQRKLIREHADDIEEDVSARIWALLGSAVHIVIERGARLGEISEVRFYADIAGDKISGQVDTYDPATGALVDFKTCSAWSVKAGPKPEWAQQLNILAFLLRSNGHSPRAASIVAIYRDWRRNEAARYGQDYPQTQVESIDIELWPASYAEAYVAERVRLHQLPDPPPCSPEERWDKPTTFAVMKDGRKSAVRVFGDELEARAFAECQKDAAKLSIVKRPGESTRCLGYCAVRHWCEYGSKLAEPGGES